MVHTQVRKNSIETVPEAVKIFDLLEKDFKSAIINMLS